MAYQVVYSSEARADLRRLRAFDARRVTDAIRDHLTHEPTRTSRSRIKRLHQPAIGQYRLRVDQFRVHYDVNPSSSRVVVLRIVEKPGGPQTVTEEPS